MTTKHAGPRPRYCQARAEATRQRLLEVGAELFATDGYQSTSSKKIAQAAGVAVGSFYNHFSDKKALLLELCRQQAEQLQSSIMASLEQSRPGRGRRKGREFVNTIVGHLVSLHWMSPALFRQLAILRYTDDDVARVLEEQESRGARRLATMLTEGGPMLATEEAETAAWVLVAAAETVVHWTRTWETPPIDAERLTAALSEMLYRYLYG